MQQSKRKKEAKESKKLAVGDYVIITNRFFDNHGLRRRDLGACEIVSLSVNGSFALLEIGYQPILVKYNMLNIIKLLKGVHVTRIQIHPLYLEKIKLKGK